MRWEPVRGARSEVQSVKSLSVMSTESAKKINRVWKIAVISAAAVLAVVAMVKNPAHLFTAGIIFAFGLESKIVKPDALDDII